MQVDDSLVTYIAGTYYNLSPILGSIKSLCGYSDKNFLLTDSNDHKTYVLKIVNKDESVAELAAVIDEVLDSASAYCCASLPASNSLLQEPHFIVPKLLRTTGDKLSTFTSVFHRNKDGGDSSQVKCNIKLFEYFDGITMFDYINCHNSSLTIKMMPGKLKWEQLYRMLGRVCNELFVFMRTQRHLIEQLRQVRGESFPWQLTTCEPHLRRLLGRIYPDKTHERRLLVEKVLDDYKRNIKPHLDQLPEFILHSDLCNKNILLNWSLNSPFKDKLCLIDFQDLQIGQQVVDLAIMMLYNVIEQEHMTFDKALKLIPQWIFSGYQSNTSALCPLETGQLLLVPVLMKLRLCQSLLNGQLAFEENPENSYVMHTNQRGWKLLELMSDNQTEYGDPRKLVNFWMNQ